MGQQSWGKEASAATPASNAAQAAQFTSQSAMQARAQRSSWSGSCGTEHPTSHPSRLSGSAALMPLEQECRGDAEPHAARSSLPAASAPGPWRGCWPGAGQAAPSSFLKWACASKPLQVKKAGRHLQNAYCAAVREARAMAHPTWAKEAPAPLPHSVPKASNLPLALAA